MIVEGLLYTKDHEWVKVEGGVATVGISDYAQEMLGEITFVELPNVGRELAGHDETAVIESTKAASEVYSPAAGKVTEVNSQLESTPELINEQCYEGGWVFKMAVTDAGSLAGLMDAAQYESYLKEL